VRGRGRAEPATRLGDSIEKPSGDRISCFAGWRLEQHAAEGADALNRSRVDLRGTAGESLLELVIDVGFEPAPATRFEVATHALHRELVDLAVEIGLQHTSDLPAFGHRGHVGELGDPHDHPPPRLGARPAAVSRSRMRARARCSRLITVPVGIPSSSAASA